MKLSARLLSATLLLGASGVVRASDDLVAVADEAPQADTHEPRKNLRRAQGFNPFDDAPQVTLPSPETLEAVPNSYIVKLKPGASAASLAPGLAKKAGGAVGSTYAKALNGFSIALPSEQASAKAKAVLANDADVESIEPDYIAHAIMTEQSNAVWGLDRVDSPGQKDGMYKYDETGAGVHIYVIDSGINTSHGEFIGRLGNGIHFGRKGDVVDSIGEDDNGHGTHCAGTAAGTTYGVAKGATLHSVKTLNRQGSGTTAAILAGMEWVIDQCEPSNKLCVASMSLGYGGRVGSVDTAAANMVSAGIVVSIAAGNSNANACNYSPITPGALTVGSVNNSGGATNSRSSFSNYGSCVDVFAPGGAVKSAWIGGSSRTNTISGTSMACPHVSGAAALLIERNGSTDGVHDAIVGSAEAGVVTNPGSGSPNLLLQTTAASTPCNGHADCTPDGDDCTNDTCDAGICKYIFEEGPGCVLPTPPPAPPTCNAKLAENQCIASISQCDLACCNGCSGADDIYSSGTRGPNRCLCSSCSGQAITC